MDGVVYHGWDGISWMVWYIMDRVIYHGWGDKYIMDVLSLNHTYRYRRTAHVYSKGRMNRVHLQRQELLVKARRDTKQGQSREKLTFGA